MAQFRMGWPHGNIAGLTPDRQHLRIGVVNATVKAQPLSIALQGICAHGVGKVWRLVQ